MDNQCFNCDRKGTEFHGYINCDDCKKDLRLFTDKTVAKHVAKFTKSAYKKELEERLKELEKIIIKKRLKLLDILSKLEE